MMTESMRSNDAVRAWHSGGEIQSFGADWVGIVVVEIAENVSSSSFIKSARAAASAFGLLGTDSEERVG